MNEKIEIHNDAAFLLNEINRLRGGGPVVGKKAFQKLIYLIKQKGVKLGYNFGLHFYGPYSEDLNMALHFLNADSVININYSGCSHRLSVDVENFDIRTDSFSLSDMPTVNAVVERYKDYTPHQLELLATALYAYEYLEDKSRISVCAGIKRVKGEKYTEQEIATVLDEFEYFNKKFA